MHLRSFLSFSNKLLNQTHLTFSSLSSPNRVSLYLQRAKLIDSIRLALRSNSPSSLLPPLLAHPSLDSFVVYHALRSAPSPDSALSFLDTLKTLLNFTHTQNTLHAIAKILAKSHRIPELHSLVNEINNGVFTNIARISFMDLLRWHSESGDLDSALRVWNDYKLALPNGNKHPCTESYNILMKLYLEKGKNLEAVGIFGRMIDEGANPNSRTYTIVINHLVDLGKLDSALKVFEILPSMRMKRSWVQYLYLVEGFSRVQRFEVVKMLIWEMRSDGILPNLSMKLALTSLRDAGFVEEVDEFCKVVLPDKRIGNIGISIDSDEDIDDDDDGDGEEVRLKPWLDPSALASALSDWNPDEVSALEKAKFVWTSRLVCKMLRNFKHPKTAWEFFCWVAYQPGEFNHDIYTISRMITILARPGHVELVDELISKVKNEGIQLSFSTVRLVIDFYGISKKADAALNVFRNVEAVCGPISKSQWLWLYSSLLRTLIKCKKGLDAMDIVEEMISSGIYPDIQIFTALLQHFALAEDLRTVQKLFGMVRQSGIEPDPYMCRIVIRAYCKCERATLALRVFEDMRNSNLIPDAPTKELLVKCLWKEGRLREAALVEERSAEINGVLPLASPGHLWTVNVADLKRVYDIYSNSFASDYC